ncbi:MAG: hypothetical protein CVU89_08460 [Firmicutes bacterium HGW-Firmicutes-14]|nr:MAG: hypothetical protein CVU89_08460 [Firmicutes bacterium HGW-Firmicutes-14]
MKRLLSLSVIMLLLLTAIFAAGCGTKEPAADDKAAGDKKTEIAYPEKPVKIIVGRKAGGSSDIVMRTLQPYLQKYLGVPVVIENVTGAGGMVAAKQVQNAPADGYTLLTMVNPTEVLTEIFLGNAPPFKEFAYVYNVAGKESNGIAVRPDSEFNTIDDLIKAGKERKLLYAAVTGLSNSTLGYAMLADKTGLEFTHIPYSSGTEATMAVVGGHADITIASLMSLRPLVESGEVRLLTYFAEEPMEDMKDVERFGDKYDGVGYSSSVGLIAPPGTPDEVVAVLVEAMDKAIQDPEFLEKAKTAFAIDPKGGEDYKNYVFGLYDYAEEIRPVIESALATK